MDDRLFFILGDLAANILAGVFVAACCYAIFDTGWNMFIAMFLAMALGMLLSMLIALPASMLFGAMEVMVPVMISGMYSGMVVGMWASMHHLGFSTALFVGGLVGFVCIVAVWITNTQLRGVRSGGQEG